MTGHCGARYGAVVCDRSAGHAGEHRGYYDVADEVLFWSPGEQAQPGAVVVAHEPVASFEPWRTCWDVLDAVVAEWDSDPKSVQCFDLRLVERARELLRARAARRSGGTAPQGGEQ